MAFVTVNDINREYDRIFAYDKEFTNNEERKDVLALKKYENEEKDKCSNLSIQLQRLDTQTLERMVRRNFANSNLMEAISCITDLILKYKYEDKIDYHFLIKKYITDLKRIGGESLMGNAFTAKFDGIDNFYVIKAPKTKDQESLLHECIVAFLATNRLRRLFPTFSYVYAIKDCSLPVTEGKSVKSWCDKEGGESVDYAFYENVSGAIPFGNFIENCSYRDFINNSLHVIMSLYMANKLYDFSHYDDHLDNILIRPVIEKKYVKYDISIIGDESGNAIYVNAFNGIPTFIDYGMSHIQINGVHYNSQVRGIGTYPNTSFLAGDIYFFIVRCVDAIKRKNSTLYSKARKFLDFFGDADELTNAKHYFLPLNDKTKEIVPEDFIFLLLEEAQKIDRSIVQFDSDNIDIYECDSYCTTFCSESCISLEGLLGKGEKSPIYKKEETVISPQDIIEKYILTGDLPPFNPNIEDISPTPPENIRLSFIPNNPQLLLKPSTLDETKEYYNTVINYLTEANKYYNEVNQLNYLLELYGKSKRISYTQNFLRQCELITNNLKNDVKILMSYKDLFKGEFSWYITEYPKVLLLI